MFHGDREKDLIIRGGYNVYPREIEEILYTHPGISEAAVIGKPHDKLGEGIVAHVTLRPDRSTTESEISTPTRTPGRLREVGDA